MKLLLFLQPHLTSENLRPFPSLVCSLRRKIELLPLNRHSYNRYPSLQTSLKSIGTILFPVLVLCQTMPWVAMSNLEVDSSVPPSFMSNNLSSDGDGRLAFVQGNRVRCTKRISVSQGRNDFTLAYSYVVSCSLRLTKKKLVFKQKLN